MESILCLLQLSTRSISRMKGLGEESRVERRVGMPPSAGSGTLGRVPRPIICTSTKDMLVDVARRGSQRHVEKAN
jgi:hypothetical protein